MLGIITQKMGLSPIVGYLLAGIVIGPYTPGFAGDTGLARHIMQQRGVEDASIDKMLEALRKLWLVEESGRSAG